MTTTNARPRLTDREIALMREIVKWRKANGVHYRGPSKIGQFIEWVGQEQAVCFEILDGEIGWGPIGRIYGPWIAVGSVTEAVDLLVALGYLPARFSTAYRDGFGRGREFQTYASNWQGSTDHAQSLLPVAWSR
jgi:hypothetical protein